MMEMNGSVFNESLFLTFDNIKNSFGLTCAVFKLNFYILSLNPRLWAQKTDKSTLKPHSR